MNVNGLPCILLYLVYLLSATPLPQPIPTENYLLHETLDHLGKYHVFWKFNRTHVTFEVHVKTRGYVGFGISPNGKMYPSDVVIGWVKDGVAHFSDRQTVGHVQPIEDPSQDWTLLHGEENEFGTMLKFQRPLITCDVNDTDIVDDTMRIIYSYHPDDPADEHNLQWHGATSRGAKSMLLLSTSKRYTLPGDIKVKDLVHQNFHVPTKRTTYQCRVYSLADIKRKHHVIKFEAVVQKGHEPFVHHMNVYKCHNYPREYIGRVFECYTVPVRMMPCGIVYAGWAVGSGPFHLPENVGLPVGENENEYAYIIEIHYNNPGAVQEIVDNSGIRFTYTSHLRQHDAGVLTVGMSEDRSQIIPPHFSDFINPAGTSEQCLSEALINANMTKINIFGVWQHAHLLGKAIKTRHFRGDIELEPISDDQHYDFDYQETRSITPEVTVRKGDSFRVECTYDSTLQKNITYGGLSTSNEMCFSFIYYYPRLPLFLTIHSLQYDTIPGHRSVHDLGRLLESYDWSNLSVRDKFQQDVLNSTIKEVCYWKSDYKHLQHTIIQQEPRVPWTPPKSKCI